MAHISSTLPLTKPVPIVLGMATHVNDNLVGWVRSLNRFGFAYHILGLGEKWGGWSWRARKYLEALLALGQEDVVVICDVYDMLAVRSAATILEKFESLDVDVIAGSERCISENAAHLDEWYTHHRLEVHPTRPNLNAGFVMGKVRRLIHMYEFIMGKEDDQIAMGQYYCAYPDRMAVDFDRRFVHNHNNYEVDLHLSEEAHFLHCPGYKFLPDSLRVYQQYLHSALLTEVDAEVKERMAAIEGCADDDGDSTGGTESVESSGSSPNMEAVASSAAVASCAA